jgi:hypothetical protein
MDGGQEDIAGGQAVRGFAHHGRGSCLFPPEPNDGRRTSSSLATRRPTWKDAKTASAPGWQFHISDCGCFAIVASGSLRYPERWLVGRFCTPRSPTSGQREPRNIRVRVGIPSGSVGQRIVRFDIVVFDSNRVAAPLSRAAEGSPWQTAWPTDRSDRASNDGMSRPCRHKTLRRSEPPMSHARATWCARGYESRALRRRARALTDLP